MIQTKLFFCILFFSMPVSYGWIITQGVQAQGVPIETSCNGNSQLDYENPTSCVRGYVYIDGKPTEGVTVLITAPNGRQHSQVTQAAIGSELPSYHIALEQPPLNVRPGDTITIQASYDEQSKSDSFVAKEGTIQIDIVLPMLRTDSAWVNAHLSARHDHAMAYDAARQKIILFGGKSVQGDHLGDTWTHTWNQTGNQTGQGWRQQLSTNNPTSRHGHTLVYDSTHNQVLLFGGQDAEGSYLNDLWAWDGTNWEQLFFQDGPTLPPARTQHSAAYHRATQQMIIFGGHNGIDALDDTWLWSDGLWKQDNRVPYFLAAVQVLMIRLHF